MSKRLPDNPVVGVVGATGAVGRVMLDILEQRRFPASEIVAIASARSAGKQVRYGDGALTVKALEDGVFDDIDLVLLDTPDDVAADWAPKAVEAGSIVVDNSAAWRSDPEVPLVIPEANPGAVDWHQGIIASPNCATIGVVVPVAALHKTYALQKMIVSTYQATSGAGRGGVEELEEQTQKLVGEMPALAAGDVGGKAPKTEMFAESIAFNILPAIGSVKDGGSTSEELKMLTESRKIMGLDNLEVITTCVRVPSVVGHGAAVHATFGDEIDIDEAEKILKHAMGVKLVDLPTAHMAAGTDPCYVGRVRRDPFDKRSLSFFTVSDNLRKGAALNAVQVAEILLPGHDGW